MHKLQQPFEYLCYDDISELEGQDAALLEAARKITAQAYAPYSNFRVGAVIRLTNGETVSGTNQENASFPAGICAERTALSVATSLFPNMAIETIAVSYHNPEGNSDQPISPCGICRQSLSEYEQRQQHPIRVILGGQNGKIYVIPAAGQLLPLSFTSRDME
ncbi:cytidine deaminase [Chitinophaga agrisoli]|uniref:Cytidine deaminase n=1 Tax=Chitinophaga agrisoli TaxID=2607653 RepID=A0A5B2VZI4_9BACT|nr:cytidine deaminase [Chitinophaga agrisoli]KAA2243742.1 cytidine deaminase [Chitinophaga agrisoli]